jgi:DNA-binding YbaB/EbfC family protein
MSDFDFGGLNDMLGGFQQRLESLKAEAARQQVTGQAGSGMVKVTATGDNQIVAVHIDQAVMDDRELLEDLVRAATNEALRRAQEASAAKLNELAGSLPLPPGILPGS